MSDSIEIMSPAGSFEAMQAAIKAGADSVYFGIEQLNMRARAANNFKISDLDDIVVLCSNHNVRTYLTLNTILYDHDSVLMKKICNTAKASGITAVIASDISVISYAHSIGLEVHISTQTNISNFDAVKFYAKYADVVVLARELTIKQIKHIDKKIKEENILGPSGKLIELELFAHGALCVAISGKCYMSLATYNSSANRGACLQNCRREYKVIDEETGDELRLENKFIMSPKDLCTIGFIDKIVDTGVRVLKLEGRGRSADYVSVVTKAYREAVDSYKAGNYTQEKIDAWIKELETVFNRGFWHGGYYCGKKLGDWSGAYGSQATKEKIYLGRGKRYFGNIGVGEFHIETGELNLGDEVVIIGPTTGSIKTTVSSLRINDIDVETANKGSFVSFPVEETIRKSDKLFVLKDRKHA